MDVKALHALWESELNVAGWQGEPVLIVRSRPERSWIWSDLHFGDRSALEAFGRPFSDVANMNDHLLREWRHHVRARDIIICLGDVGHPEAWRDRRLILDIRNCPGDRFLILGNHDQDRNALREAGFATECTLALCATDPPLALSHFPLRQVPPGAINLHGHLHEGTEPTMRHINLALEQVGYSPAGLTWVLAEAQRRRARAEWAERPIR